jgi:indole-3-glycerol phosphate synthase / phosphoribosylanthranilate isomerase
VLMPITLSEIVANRKMEVEQLKTARLLESLPPVVKANGQFLVHGARLTTITKNADSGAVSLICEIKPRSPRHPGSCKTDIDKLIRAYTCEAAGISVLTETKFFGGSFELLAHTRTCTHLPLLCKDFVIDVYQCLLARACGAQAVLLIAKILDDYMLALLKRQVEALGMVPVIEVQNEVEMQRTLDLEAQAILINNRDLDTLEIDIVTTARLTPLVPRDVLLISASGIDSHAQIEQLAPYCSVFLVGSALMHAADPVEKMLELKGLKVAAAAETKLQRARL